jgi:hypothetical protein
VYNPSRTADRTNAAISATAGQVRVFSSSGNIARTEYSSTSGGWTAGGTFPARQDLGDSISPVHTWSARVSARPLETAYGNGSRLTSIAVTSRNGLGAMGGRALEVRLRFANGTTRTVTGDQVRSTLGLRSNWFSVQIDSDPVGSYITAAYQLFLNRNPSSSDINRWRPEVEPALERQTLRGDSFRLGHLRQSSSVRLAECVPGRGPVPGPVERLTQVVVPARLGGVAQNGHVEGLHGGHVVFHHTLAEVAARVRMSHSTTRPDPAAGLGNKKERVPGGPLSKSDRIIRSL